MAKTPKRKSATSRPGQLKFTERNDDTKQGSVKSSDGATSRPMLNSLVYKEVMQIVKEKEDVRLCTFVISFFQIAVVPVCVLLTHFCFNVRLFS